VCIVPSPTSHASPLSACALQERAGTRSEKQLRSKLGKEHRKLTLGTAEEGAGES